MATLVLTVIGDDQAGLVEALSGVVAEHGGNWDKSHMAQLAGKFAGIVQVTVPDAQVDALVAELEPLAGLLDVAAELATDSAPAVAETRMTLEIVGLDRAGIVHDVAHALAVRNVSIDDLQTQTRSAPMAGGTLFEAVATIALPDDVTGGELRRVMHELADELVVDIELREVDER